MSWRIEPFPEEGALLEGAIEVYAAAFAPPPYSDPDRGEEIRYRLRSLHRERLGFRGFISLSEPKDVSTPSHGVVGMTYGYCSQRGQWWRDVVARKLDRQARKQWLDSAYELVEIAVHPSFQNQGVGAILVNNLLEGRPESTCVLSTRTDSRAHNLYARLGFEIVTEMTFTPGGAPFYVMGKML
ncbi:MAG: hypothetical protein CL897_05595 [Dehalococcoidia bacterium]|nr:hypothetical protein [Dehalococcoidia bacterium]